MVDLREDIWNLVIQPLEASYLHYKNAYDHQTLQVDDLR